MRFNYPRHPAEFEEPDEWLAEAEISSVRRSTTAWRSSPDASLVPLRDIEPPTRLPEHPKDWKGFDRVRLVSILRAIVSNTVLAPVPLLRRAQPEWYPAPFRYRTTDGYHRFHACIVAGFELLPSEIIPDLVG